MHQCAPTSKSDFDGCRPALCPDRARAHSYSIPILGEMVHRPAEVDPALVSSITSSVAAQLPGFAITPGKTMSTDCFYEGQGRLDGGICEYDNDGKMAFLAKLHDYGVGRCTWRVEECGGGCAGVVGRGPWAVCRGS